LSETKTLFSADLIFGIKNSLITYFIHQEILAHNYLFSNNLLQLFSKFLIDFVNKYFFTA